MYTRLRSILLLAVVAVAMQTAVQAGDYTLSDASRDKLGKEARQAYDQSQTYLDKVNYPAALDALIAAFEKEPNMPELGFLVGAFAAREARKRTGEEAIAVLHKSEAAYERVLAIESLRHADRQIAEAALAKVKADIAGEGERDARIQKTGQALIKSQKEMIDQLRQQRQAEIDQQNSFSSGGATGAPGGGGQNPGGMGNSGASGSNMGGNGGGNGYYSSNNVNGLTNMNNVRNGLNNMNNSSNTSNRGGSNSGGGRRG